MHRNVFSETHARVFDLASSCCSHFCQLHRYFGYLRDSGGTSCFYVGNWIKPSVNIISRDWSGWPATVVFSISRPVIIVRAGAETMKCSLNLHLIFNNSKVNNYTQQRRKVRHEFNIFLLNIAIMVSLLKKNKHMKKCCTILHAWGQNLILHALWYATYKRLAAGHNSTSFSTFRQDDTMGFGWALCISNICCRCNC